MSLGFFTNGCRTSCARKDLRPSSKGSPPFHPAGRYFRMLLTGEENSSKASVLSAASADAARESLSLREFFSLASAEAVPGHSSLCRIRQRLSLEIYHEVFVFVLRLLKKSNLRKSKYWASDAQAMEANAAMKSIVRRDAGQTYQKMLERLAEESGIKTPSKAELIAFDRKRRAGRPPTRTGNRLRMRKRA